MRKIKSLFERDYEGNRLVIDSVVKGSEWVQSGEGVATIKHDGTCCLVRDGKLYKRYQVKKDRTPPVDFEPTGDIDLVTGKQVGWVPVTDGKEDDWHREAFRNSYHRDETPDGTYELCGPKVQKNPNNYQDHVLIRHGSVKVPGWPTQFNDLMEWFKGKRIEGIVWHHPDGRMVKIKKKDFGLKLDD